MPKLYRSDNLILSFKFFFSLCFTFLLAFNAATAQNISLVKDIKVGAESSLYGPFAVMQNKAYFSARDSIAYRIWVSDGTEEGTYRIGDSVSVTEIAHIKVIQNELLVYSGYTPTTGNELFRATGEIGEEELIVDLAPGSDSAFSGSFRADSNRVCFVDTYKRLHCTDGTTEGTKLLMTQVHGIGLLHSLGTVSYFRLFTTADQTFRLFRTDGTPEGTYPLTEMSYGSYFFGNRQMVIYNNLLYFFKQDEEGNWFLYKTDGTVAGTEEVMFLNPPDVGTPNSLVISGENLYFMANDGINGQEIYKSDGTAAGTEIVTDFINEDNPATFSPYSLTAFQNGLLFTKTDTLLGAELWKTDGTAAGTYLIKDINPGEEGSAPWLRTGVAVDSVFYFSAYHEDTGEELWRTDGTEAGTYLAADICTGECSSSPAAIKKLTADSFVFSAETEESGRELYALKSTVSSTIKEVILSDNNLIIYPNPTQDGRVKIRRPAGIFPQSVEIISMTGEQIRTCENIASGDTFDLSLSVINPGQYLVVLKDKAGDIVAQGMLSVF